MVSVMTELGCSWLDNVHTDEVKFIMNVWCGCCGSESYSMIDLFVNTLVTSVWPNEARLDEHVIVLTVQLNVLVYDLTVQVVLQNSSSQNTKIPSVQTKELDMKYISRC